MAEKKYDIFISYRHGEEAPACAAGRMHERFIRKGYAAFLDFNIYQAEEADEQIRDIIKECNDFILLLSPGVFDKCTDASGDHLMKELDYALKYRKNIIPVFMRGFEWPEVRTDSIRSVQMFAGIPLNMEFFDAVMDKICNTLLVSRAPE